MRVHALHISAFKGLDVTIPWASAVVLFGPNDSGKTNILEGLLAVFAEGAKPRSERYPFPGNEGVDVELLVELDGLDLEGHRDQELFLSWLRPMIEAVEEDSPWVALKQSLARLEDVHATDRVRAVVDLIDEVRAAIREEALSAAAQNAADLEAIDTDLRSRWFRINWLSVSWLVPPEGALVDDPRQWTEFIDLGEPEEIGPSLIRAIRVDASQEGFDDLYSRLERFIENELEYREYYESRVSPEPLVRADFVSRYSFRPVSFRDDWLERDGNTISLRPTIEEACVDLTARINDLAPRFVSRSYEVRVVPHLPDEWRMLGGRRVSIRLRPHTQSEDFDLDVTSSGIGVWTSYAVSEAIRLAEEERQQQFPKRGVRAQIPGATVYVFDEPERHLHPLAQEEAAAWIAARAREGAHIWLATHAVPFLRLPLGDVEYLKVTRSHDWQTLIESITDDTLAAVAGSAGALGLPPVALIQLTRGWLVVEGEHDRQVLDAHYGRDLRQAGIQILPLRGAARAKASFLNLAALAPLGLPFFVLLDNTRAAEVERGKIAAPSKTEEERIAEQIIRLRDEEDVDVEVLGLPYPDMICALPLDALDQVARENGGQPEAASSWSELIANYERLRAEAAGRTEKTPDFKRFVLDSFGLRDWNPDHLVAAALRASGGHPPHGSPLARIVSRIVATVDDPSVDLA